MFKIAVDAMGGDFGLDSTIKASVNFLKKNKDTIIYLYGKKDLIENRLQKEKIEQIKDRLIIKNCDNVLDMGEKDPVSAIRKNKDTASLCVAMKDCKEKEVDAVVTSGPTQCVVVASHLLIRRLPQTERIALTPFIPNLDGKARILLDVGANVELKPEHISKLATIATITAKEVLGYKNPTVGLLNIGSEKGKGREIDNLYYMALENNKDINFYGNVEPTEVLNSPTDIIITDGFTGNICMKTIEGTAKSISSILKEEIKRSFFGKIGYLFMRKNLKRFKKRLDSKEIGGAMILGVNSPVIKAHGNSDDYAFFNAIRQAKIMVEKDVIGKIIASLDKENKDEH